MHVRTFDLLTIIAQGSFNLQQATNKKKNQLRGPSALQPAYHAITTSNHNPGDRPPQDCRFTSHPISPRFSYTPSAPSTPPI